MAIGSEFARAARPSAATKTDELAAQLRTALVDSDRHPMIADVPVAAFLSAGVDSATLVALMAQSGDDRLSPIAPWTCSL